MTGLLYRWGCTRGILQGYFAQAPAALEDAPVIYQALCLCDMEEK
jgi:hypothetical protein